MARSARPLPARTRNPAAAVVWLAATVLVPCSVAPAANDLVHRARTALPGVVSAVEAGRRGAPIPAKLRPPFATIKLFPPGYRISPACISTNSSPAVPSRVCRIGRPGSKKVIVLFGDSHAFMWQPAIVAMARRDGWAVVPLIRFGCTPGRWLPDAQPSACRDWFRWALRRIGQLRPVTLLGGSIGERPSPETRAATAGVLAATRALRRLGRLVVIGDPEGLAGDPVNCLRARNASMSTCTTTWPASSLGPYDAVARATKRLGVGFLATRGFVCYRRQCPAVVGRTIVWMDNSHLTGVYSLELAGPFRAAFLRATDVRVTRPLAQ